MRASNPLTPLAALLLLTFGSMAGAAAVALADASATADKAAPKTVAAPSAPAASGGTPVTVTPATAKTGSPAFKIVRPVDPRNVYEGQSDFTEEELLRFIRHLPDFRSWLKTSGEKAEPTMKKGKPDFAYSPGAAQWAEFRGWEARRFFCVMGRSAAAMVVVSEGEKEARRFRDMPRVSRAECDLVQKHLGELLKAGSDAAR